MLISTRVIKKLEEKHHVSKAEIFQCFVNRSNGFLIDNRLLHQTDPSTKWFISETDKGRKLKIVFIEIINPETKCKEVSIKTAYDANQDEIDLYNSKFKM